jgi:hypothetical protein
VLYAGVIELRCGIIGTYSNMSRSFDLTLRIVSLDQKV